jgi:glyoxylase-like metal-dependent hydrolase (beta-lactamase superfamily II)
MTRTSSLLTAFAAAVAVCLFSSEAPAQSGTTYMPGAPQLNQQRVGPPDTTTTVTVSPLADGVYAAKVNYVWTGWVELPDGLLLIDSGLDERTAKVLADSIRARSGSKPFKYLVNTHAHKDHTGGNAYFVAQGAKVMAQAHAAAVIDSLAKIEAAASSPGNPRPAPAPVVRIDRRKTLGPASRTVELIWLGKRAHTDGDLIVYLPKQKVLFAGDLISNRAVPWMIDPKMDRLGWIASVDSLRSKRFASVIHLVPGHGVMEKPLEEIDYTWHYLHDAWDRASKIASYGTSVKAFKDWGYLGRYEGSEFYAEVHFMNMRRLYTEALGIKTPGRPGTRAYKK